MFALCSRKRCKKMLSLKKFKNRFKNVKKDLKEIKINGDLTFKNFQVQGESLDKFAKKSVKVLVVGNPANTNALICSHYAPSIPKENFSAMTRLDQNRAAAQLANKAGVGVADVKNVIIWGNHSSTQFPDAAHATISGKSIFDIYDFNSTF